MKGLQDKVCEEWLESVGLSPRSWRKTSWWSPASYREWRVGGGERGEAHQLCPTDHIPFPPGTPH